MPSAQRDTIQGASKKTLRLCKLIGLFTEFVLLIFCSTKHQVFFYLLVSADTQSKVDFLPQPQQVRRCVGSGELSGHAIGPPRLILESGDRGNPKPGWGTVAVRHLAGSVCGVQFCSKIWGKTVIGIFADFVDLTIFDYGNYSQYSTICDSQ